MAVEIGALRALLSLDSAAFEKGAKRASASMNGLQRKLNQAAKRMKSIGKKMSMGITAPLVGATSLLVKSSMATIDAQSKMAQSLGTSTASMQVLARAADRAGISTGELEQVGRQLTKRMSQAATGTGPAVKALDKLGLKAGDLTKMDLDQQIAVINRAIKGTVPEAEQAAVAMALFGDRAGIAAGRLDADTIATAADELERFGVTVSEVDADSIEEANDAISAIGLVTKGLGNQLAVALAPTLKSIAEKIADLGHWFSSLSPKMKQLTLAGAGIAAAIGPVAIAFGFLATGLAAIASPIGLVIIGLAAMAGAAAYVVTNWDSLKERFPVLQTAATRLGDAWVVLKDKVKTNFENIKTTVTSVIDGIKSLFEGDIIGSLTHFGEAWTTLKATIVGNIESSLDLIKALFPDFMAAGEDIVKEIADGIRNFISDIGGAIDQLVADLIEWVAAIPGRIAATAKKAGRDIVNKIVEGITSNTAAVRKEVESQYEGIGEDAVVGVGKGVDNSMPALMNEMRGHMGDLEGETRDAVESDSPSKVYMRIGNDLMNGLGIGITEKAQAAAQAAANAAAQVTDAADQEIERGTDKLTRHFDSIGDAMAGAIVQGQSMAQALGQVFQQIAQDLIGSGISQMIKGIFGAAFGGGGAALGAGGKGFGTSLLAFRASGGPVGRGKPYVVGENGPELMIPGASGTIIPNHKLGAGGGDNGTRVEVVPNPYFDVHVTQLGRQAAAPMVAGAARAQQRAHGSQSQRFSQRGTMT